MSEQITITMPEQTLKRARQWAALMGCSVDEAIVRMVESAVYPLGHDEEPPPVETWTDEEVLAAADSMMPADDDRRLSELLGRQREGLLTAPERAELSALMAAYQEGQLRKALALREAVRRGLREPLNS